MKNILFSALFIFSSLLSYSRSGSGDTLYWSESVKLKWEDFAGKADAKTGRLSQATMQMDARFRKGIKATTSVQSLFLKKLSCILPEEKTPAMLSYYQTMFDLHEAEGRKLRKVYKETKLGLDPEKIFQEKYKAALDQLEKRIDQYMEETENGENAGEIGKWNKMVQKELKAMEAFSK